MAYACLTSASCPFVQPGDDTFPAAAASPAATHAPAAHTAATPRRRQQTHSAPRSRARTAPLG